MEDTLAHGEIGRYFPGTRPGTRSKASFRLPHLRLRVRERQACPDVSWDKTT